MIEPSLVGRDGGGTRRHAAVLHARCTGGDEDSIPPTPEQYHRELLDEARRIAKGHSCLQPDREHLEALVEENARLMHALKEIRRCLNGL